jgi:4'-phosphopantetheinyl transferase
MCENLSLKTYISTLSFDWNPWEATAATPQLLRDSIHLWTLDLAAVDSESYADCLVRDDRVRAARILDPEKRSLYLGGRAGIRALLSRYTDSEPSELKFGYGSRGKPKLLDGFSGTSPSFNYTLSRDKVLYAISMDRQLGVDMEVLPRTISTAPMAKRKLTDAERRSWQGLPLGLRNDSMLCCWTRKEAYGKAIGVGIRFRLGQVNLFDRLDQYYWQTSLDGLFEHTDYKNMPELLEGVQLSLPFDAVASLMYERENSRSDRPEIMAMQLNL